MRTSMMPSEVLMPHPSRAEGVLCDTVPRFEPAVEAFPVKKPIEVFEANGCGKVSCRGSAKAFPRVAMAERRVGKRGIMSMLDMLVCMS